MGQRKHYEEYEEKVYTNKHACLDEKSRERERHLDDDGYRSPFQRDIHRITYSQPFRRLRHKTQVFFLTRSDHVCTRLEHSIYVAQASRTVARLLCLNEDLAEAIGLGHDIGHAPFGHHGESVLNCISELAGLGINFQHELNGLRIVDRLGKLDRYDEPGLNLTYAVRDGIVSHNGEAFKNDRELTPTNSEAKCELKEISDRGKAGNPTTMEGCIVRMVDKIAYAGRDLEDGLTTELIEEKDIPKGIVDNLGEHNGMIVKTLITDLVEQSELSGTNICLSLEKHALLCSLIDFNYSNIYKSSRVENYKNHATAIIKALYDRICEDMQKSNKLKDKSLLRKQDVHNVYKDLDDFMQAVGYKESERVEQIVFDFICGMTDNYVESCFDSLVRV